MKKIMIIICTIFLLAISSMVIAYLTSEKYITSDEAKAIAMEDVSNKDGEYSFNSVEFAETNDTYIYTLVFTDKINNYTYKINAETKKIISSKKESLTNNKTYMKEEDILAIVFKHSRLNRNDCTLLSNLVILEDGIPIYNTTFYHDNIRYDYKTNAFTGAIISVIKLNENAI
ncbi:MAG: PepSY domain-containing protein [Bacilli bacterium]|nr:PepSY domain-containing protein [Bacilli bacterium]